MMTLTEFTKLACQFHDACHLMAENAGEALNIATQQEQQYPEDFLRKLDRVDAERDWNNVKRSIECTMHQLQGMFKHLEDNRHRSE